MNTRHQNCWSCLKSCTRWLMNCHVNHSGKFFCSCSQFQLVHSCHWWKLMVDIPRYSEHNKSWSDGLAKGVEMLRIMLESERSPTLGPCKTVMDHGEGHVVMAEGSQVMIWGGRWSSLEELVLGNWLKVFGMIYNSSAAILCLHLWDVCVWMSSIWKPDFIGWIRGWTELGWLSPTYLRLYYFSELLRSVSGGHCIAREFALWQEPYILSKLMQYFSEGNIIEPCL